MERNEIRIGRVSSLNPENGTVRVVYKDKDNAVTMELPTLNLDGEYKMPQVDDLVLVAHLSNGSAAGVVLGTFWSLSNQPKDPAATWRKEIGEDAYQHYKGTEYRVKAGTIKLQTDANTMDVDDVLARIRALESDVEALDRRVDVLEGGAEPEPEPEPETGV